MYTIYIYIYHFLEFISLSSTDKRKKLGSSTSRFPSTSGLKAQVFATRGQWRTYTILDYTSICSSPKKRWKMVPKNHFISLYREWILTDIFSTHGNRYCFCFRYC